MEVYFNYYKYVLIYNLTFSTAIALVLGPLLGGLVFATFGLVLGIIIYNIIHKNQYYFFYNLGITKRKLMFNAFLINPFVSLLVCAVFYSMFR